MFGQELHTTLTKSLIDDNYGGLLSVVNLSRQQKSYSS